MKLYDFLIIGDELILCVYIYLYVYIYIYIHTYICVCIFFKPFVLVS